MRKCLIILSILVIYLHPLLAQTGMTNSYDARWKSVESFFKKGLNASAQKEIEIILKQAKADENTEQYIKALCNYRVSTSNRDEKSEVNDILYFEKEIQTAKFPAKQLLHSMIADLYWSYYQGSRWEILDRTNISTQEKNSNNDIETWAAYDFFLATYRHYMLSLTERDKQKTFSLKSLNLIIEPGVNTAHLRPTLFDLLVHRAIDYFGKEENELTIAEYHFEIEDNTAFAPATDFIDAVFKTSDTVSQKYIALKLYQDILSFHENDKDPSALIDADIARIRYVHDKSILSNKKELYVDALKELYNRYPNNEQAAIAQFYYAETMMPSSGHYGNQNPEIKANYPEAKKICEAIIRKFPSSEAGYRAQVLVSQIEQHSLGIQTEKAVLPNKPSLALINYRNISTIYCRVVSMSMKEYKEINYDYNERFGKLMDNPIIKQWQVDLPNKEDYKNHSTEIKIDALPIGSYAVIISESEKFSAGNYTVFSYMQVSNLAYISASQHNGNGTSMYVVHRESGQPINGATLKLWTNNYDYDSRKQKLTEVASYITNVDGMVTLSTKNQSYIPEVIFRKDNLLLFDNIYVNSHEPQTQTNISAFLFTDRSIYRPGQTIYFKGIVLSSTVGEKRKHELLKNRQTKVQFFDANYEMLKEETFTTNEFGSFSGTFKAPDGLLTGQFHIQCENQEAYFNVEEYKRPKFEVSFDTLQKTYRLHDEIQVNVRANAFAGNAISDAKVNYIVTREARFPYLWCFYKWGMPSSPSMVIAHGTGVTKEDGTVTINFNAIPDASIDRKTLPVFDYKVSVDITDLNGETRSGVTTIPVAYQSLMVILDIPKEADINTFNEVHIQTSNLAGLHIPSTVTLTLKKLLAPNKVSRSRLWPKADINSISEMDFRRDFPFDEYNNENDYLQWKDEKVIWSKTLTTSKTGKIDIQQLEKNANGWFVLEATAKDKDGEIVIDKKYIRLSDYKNLETLANEHLLVSKIKLKAEPGETASLMISYPYETIFVLYQDKRNPASWLNLHYPRKAFEYAITEADRGGFYVKMMFIKNNRVYESTEHVDVPWTNKELTISTETFRNKMLPGSEQEWKLKITGSKKELVAAELLATMYDASLDAFTAHQWHGMNLFQENYNTSSWSCGNNFMVEAGRQIYYRDQKNSKVYNKRYGFLKLWGLINGGEYGLVGRRSDGIVAYADGAPPPIKPQVKFTPPVLKKAEEVREDEKPPAADSYTWSAANAIDEASGIFDEADSAMTPMDTKSIQLRSNFAETAFFFPHLQTDKEGNVILNFKAPDALTKWKLMAYAHTQDLNEGMLTETSVTQKELMIVPNTPRFFREGDKMLYSAKITNLNDKDIEGHALLQLEDAMSETSVDELFLNKIPQQTIHLKAGESISVNWNITVPKGYANPITVKTFAKAHGSESHEEFSDGEQHVIPLLLNSILVTETMPLSVKMNTTRKFQFKKLLEAEQSSTLQHHRVTIEYTSNPAWYAIQALPYLTDFPYECAEQTFNRYYANALASHIANSNPKIKAVFSSWKEKDSAALLSNLQKNEELKSALLQETPWVLEAKNEAEQKRNIAQLFNLNRMSTSLEKTLKDLTVMQTPNGGFSWFKGMPDDRFVTQYIITGIGRLQHLGVSEVGSEQHIQELLAKAIPYLDARLNEDYNYLIKHKIDVKNINIGYTQIQYLYMRSFFIEKYPLATADKMAFDYYKNQCALFWLNTNKYMQAMSAVTLQRLGNFKVAKDIINSLRENAIHHEELGMYWKEINNSYWWYEAPIETQAMMVECFKEVAQRENEVDELKLWLLKNKQTTNWKTTKATADACYALLLNGTSFLSAEPEVSITMGGKRIDIDDNDKEAGTGYFKTSIMPDMIKPSLGDIQVTVRNEAPDATGTTWGAVYWQYFEDLDKITSAETPLSLKKQLFKVSNTEKGEVLIPISESSPLQVGDKVKVRIELRVDREMEYVHLKDMRAACFEPINVLSEYKYQGGLGYYEATKDLATNFFFSELQKGTYVFEYPMFTTNKGDFSNGIATIQCMYAPGFSSHSEGVRVRVE